ncbi:MAG: phosphonate ABC transporter, permease protein PhnE [Oceanidesulfovibrio sp.]
MQQQITLDHVTPRRTLPQKFRLGALFVVALGLLVLAWEQTDINPLKLYNKRENAFTYLFGDQLNEMEQKEAMDMAERMPRIIAYEEAYQDLKAQYAGQDKSRAELRKMADKEADARVAAMEPTEKEKIIQESYGKTLSERKGGYFPPETAPAKLKSYGVALIETVFIAIWGSLFAFIAAIPVAMFAARNTLELMVQGHGQLQRFLRWTSQFLVRRLLDFCRGFNEFVMALIFVAVIGLGPFAGVLALAIHTFGILGKVFSEAIESIEPGQVEAAKASGANPAQIISFAVLPQVMPLVVSYSLLRFESNVRSATILGFVGAGGIGFLMFDKLNGYLYREVCTMMIMVILSVTIIDYLCAMLRRRFT